MTKPLKETQQSREISVVSTHAQICCGTNPLNAQKEIKIDAKEQNCLMLGSIFVLLGKGGAGGITLGNLMLRCIFPAVDKHVLPLYIP